MKIASSARVHPSAVLSGDIEIGENVEVGALAVIDGNVTIGRDCVIRPGAYLFGNVILGHSNQIFSGSVIGEKPQHLKYNDEPTYVEIGDCNTFREHVTVHRGTTHSMTTKIGSHNYFMASSHVAHDCIVGNRCILANNALLGGHCHLEDNVYISGNSALHQFVRVGRLAMLGGVSGSSKDVPPFVIQQNINLVCGINVVGMRRAGLSNEQINFVRQAFRLLFREGLILSVAMERIQRNWGHVDVVQELLTFLRKCPKGINGMVARNFEEAA